MNKRIEKLRSIINENEVALISSYPNIFYYSGFTSSDAYLLISKDKQILATDSRYFVQAKEQAPDFKIKDISKGLDNVFSSFEQKYIGYEEGSVSVREYRRIRSKTTSNQQLVEMEQQICAPRKTKDEDEIKLIAQAEKIGDMAFSHIIEYIKPGMTERQVALEIEFFMKNHGASALSFDTIVASGVRSAMPHGTASDKVIEKGDIVTMDFGCVYKGYCSDMTRTVVMGKADAKQKEIYDIVLKTQENALQMIKAGEKCNEIDQAAHEYVSVSGYGGCFGHGLGHSVGIEIHEMPSLSKKCQSVLKKGNVVTVEPGIYIENYGGVRIEDLVVVEEDGITNLTHSTKELLEL